MPLFLVFRIIELKNEKNSSSRKIKELKGTGATKQGGMGKRKRKVEGPCGNLTFTCTCQGIGTFISLRLDSRSSFNENVGRIYSLIM